MALNLRRWVLAAILACGVTAAAYLPPSQPQQQQWAEFQADANRHFTPERAREKRIEADLEEAQNALALTLRRDTRAQLIRRQAPRPHAPPALLIEQSRTMPGWARRAIWSASAS